MFPNPEDRSYGVFMRFFLGEMKSVERLLQYNVAQTFNTGKPQTLDLVKRWLHDCCHKHGKRCRPPVQQSYVPTRLLDVKVNGENNVCLLTKDIFGFRDVQYATLSHCWGNMASLKLTEATFDALKSGIPTSQVPRTFADAVSVARHLEIQYLWIDSLCIFQDFEDNWRRESSRMHEVYSNGVVNLAASGVFNSSYGSFSDRDPLSIAPCKVSLLWNSGSSQECYMQNEESLKWQLKEEPLLQRGWVMQERLLAPRVVYFGSNELF